MPLFCEILPHPLYSQTLSCYLCTHANAPHQSHEQHDHEEVGGVFGAGLVMVQRTRHEHFNTADDSRGNHLDGTYTTDTNTHMHSRLINDVLVRWVYLMKTYQVRIQEKI